MRSPSEIPVGPPARQAIGVVAPFDMELDAELWRWMPPEADLLLTRTPFVDAAVTVEFVTNLSDADHLAVAVRSLVAGRVDDVAYACTSASFVGGQVGEREIRRVMQSAGAGNALTTSGALLEALSALEVTRVSLATPYVPEVSAFLEAFLREHEIDVVGHESLGLDREIWNVPYARTAELIRSADRPDAEAIFVSCTNLPSYDLIAPLEREIGKPIISANQATMWAALRRRGLSAVGEGQALLAH